MEPSLTSSLKTDALYQTQLVAIPTSILPCILFLANKQPHLDFLAHIRLSCCWREASPPQSQGLTFGSSNSNTVMLSFASDCCVKGQMTQFCPIAHGWKSVCVLLRNFTSLIWRDQKHDMPFSCLLAFGCCCVRTLNLNLLQSSRVLVGTSRRMKVNTWRWQSWKMETFWVTEGLVSH